jgi:hypothetical protein
VFIDVRQARPRIDVVPDLHRRILAPVTLHVYVGSNDSLS